MRRLPVYSNIAHAERRGYGWGQGLGVEGWSELPPRINKSLTLVGSGTIVNRISGIFQRARDAMSWGQSGLLGFGVVNRIRSLFK